MGDSSLDLKSFKIPLGRLAPQQSFRTRSGDLLSYRIYPAWTEDVVVLYHGVGADSRYMCVLASALATAGVATVVTPDFRCHGISGNLSDEITPSQLEVDLEELLIHIKSQRAVARITLAGHSMGGGFALRVAVSEIRRQFSRFVALAPYFPPALNVHHQGYGGWITPKSGGGFSVNMPELFRTGSEKLEYSAAYLRAVTPPENLIQLLQELQPPVYIATGAQDEVQNGEASKQLLRETGVSVKVIEGLKHLTLVSKPEEVLSLFEMPLS